MFMKWTEFFPTMKPNSKKLVPLGTNVTFIKGNEMRNIWLTLHVFYEGWWI